MNGRSLGVLLIAVVSWALSSLLGCAGRAVQTDEAPRLPFTVKLRRFELPPEEKQDADPITPANFESPERLTERFRQALEEAGTFSRVIVEDVAGVEPDLEITATILGNDFGAGTPLFQGGALSTVAWTVAGHASWFIDDMQYPNSEVRMALTIQTPGPEPKDLFTDELLVSDLTLSLRERLDFATSVKSIVLPPWCTAGDPKSAGSSLAKRAMDRFARWAPQQIIAGFPSDHLEKLACFLVHDPETSCVIISALGELRAIKIRYETGGELSLDEDDVDSAEVPAEEREAVKLRLLRTAARFSTYHARYYYQFDLAETDSGYVKITGTLDEGEVRWTIFQPPRGTHEEASVTVDRVATEVHVEPGSARTVTPRGSTHPALERSKEPATRSGAR